MIHQPKGFLIAIGGSEDKGEEVLEHKKHRLDFFKDGILNNIVELAGKREEPRIEIVATASSIPDEVGNLYKKAFKKLDCANVGYLKIASREDAENKKVLERLAACNCLLFSGGDQLRLCSVLGGTEFIDRVKDRYYNEPFVIAGTSAGAAAMSNTMIHGGVAETAYLKGQVELSLGFGLLQGVIIDTHFDARGRFGRLAQAIASQPGAIGVGLGEDSGVIVERGSKLKAIGSSSVILIDGFRVRYNNIAEIKDGMPISVENLQVHIMAHSDIYNIITHQFTGVKYLPHHH